MRLIVFVFAALFAGVGAFAQSAEGGPAVAVSPPRHTIIGGKEVGWFIDFSQVSRSQRWEMGWSDDGLTTSSGLEKYDNVALSASGVAGWRVTGRDIALSTGYGPSFISIIKIDGSTTTVRDIMLLQYRAMSLDRRGLPHGFDLDGEKCVEIAADTQSCAIPLKFESPPKSFYAVFHSWKVGDSTFVLTVRNAQPVPDRAKPEEGMKILVSLIRIGSSD